ncbi:hypothetical protein DTO021D3_6335 [Paecilomyces variotii]|nr:hypothetical protein DTO032I3_8652 [Paecilomyces variotii]KAJ9276730.1 hypothetical protein DTO021D3_6335 [Paecilomyces variotii]KAJ9345766.1 hypothetical protein DTO027B6_1726 [Paecilomyces variotii]KAJ9387386.1 hypothetical protein DTO032I4_3250 [Paecilomyces variotii]
MGPPRRAPPRKGTSSNTTSKEGKQQQKQQKKKQTPPTTSRRANHQEGERQRQQRLGNEKEEEKIDLSITIPISLQQLLLNIFKAGLLRSSYDAGQENGREEEEEELDMKTLIQTIKSHLYNRDFDSAFTDANEELLRAYALRWSASRALGYAGIFRGVVGSGILEFKKKREVDEGMSGGEVVVKRRRRRDGHVLCIGGGAGAEIVALACVWRDLMDEEERGKLERQGNETETEKDGGEGGDDDDDDDAQSISSAVGEMTLTKEDPDRSLQDEVSSSIPNISITAVDIADWSSVVNRLSSTIRSSDIPSSKAHPAPLLPPQDEGSLFSISFQKSDILTLSDSELRTILHKDNNSTTILVTLMFTLNELFSVSMAKTTAFLLRITDLLEPGTVLLVVDSPGSYSTVTLGKSKSSTTKPESESSSEPDKPQQRNYPMKFLLDHTLLSVAAGKWDKVLSQDSRWFRRDAAKLRYAVGEGAGLEDMRFQIHVYKRLET